MQTTPPCPSQTETETESETGRQIGIEAETDSDKEQPANRQTDSDREGNSIIGLISNPIMQTTPTYPLDKRSGSEALLMNHVIGQVLHDRAGPQSRVKGYGVRIQALHAFQG